MALTDEQIATIKHESLDNRILVLEEHIERIDSVLELIILELDNEL